MVLISPSRATNRTVTSRTSSQISGIIQTRVFPSGNSRDHFAYTLSCHGSRRGRDSIWLASASSN